jgi:hypothetical protein
VSGAPKATHVGSPVCHRQSPVAKFGLSQLNIAYYTIHDLRRLKPGQTHLYLLCYAWHRYRQLTDNLVEAFGYHTRHLEDDTKVVANKQATQIHNERQQATPRVGELLFAIRG